MTALYVINLSRRLLTNEDLQQMNYKNFIALLVSIVCLNVGVAQQLQKTYFFETPTIENIDEFQVIKFNNTLLTAPLGQPVLPYQQVKLLLPPNTIASNIELVYGPEIQVNISKQIYPQQNVRTFSDNVSSEFVMDNEIYKQKGIYPAEKTGKLINSVFHGHNVLLSSFTPVNYNPTEGTATYYSWVKVVVETETDNKINLISQNESRKDHVTSFVDNPKLISEYKYTRKSGSDNYDMLIVTGADYKERFENFIPNYSKRGLVTRVITTDSISSCMSGQDLQEKIRNFIIQEYQNCNIEFVLLGGDVEIIPHRGFYCFVESGFGYSDSNIPADLYYSALDGNWNTNGDNKWGEPGEDDLLPEVSVGRLPFSNMQELDNMLFKSQKYIFEPVANEHDKVLLAGEFLYDDPLSYGSDYLNLLIGLRDDNGYTTNGIPFSHSIDSLYDEYGSWSATTIIEKINEGYPLLFHVGHANSNYVMKLYTHQITNANFYNVNGITHNFPLIYSHGCICGAFDDNDCIGETMVKINNLASVFIGNSRYGWFNEGQTEGPSAHLNREFVSALFGNNINNVGQAHKDSKTATAPWVTAPGQWEPGALRWCFYCCNVLGDPALALYTDIPRNITVTYPNNIASNSTSMNVSVSSNEIRTDNITCVVMINDTIIGKAITDNNGNATINFNVPLYGNSAKLYVSGLNIVPTEYPITISSLGTQYNAKLNFSISPNPATHNVSIILNEDNETVSYSIYDMQGKLVLSDTSISSDKININVSQFKEGLYIVKVVAGDKLGYSKLVVK